MLNHEEPSAAEPQPNLKSIISNYKFIRSINTIVYRTFLSKKITIWQIVVRRKREESKYFSLCGRLFVVITEFKNEFFDGAIEDQNS
jgi:hypothetical protein